MAKSAKKAPKEKADKPAVWHDENGKFAKGNPGGPGRPFRRQQRFLVTLNDSVSDSQWKTIIATAVTQAMEGDRYARDWLSKWLLGQPETIPVDEKRTIIDVLTDGGFVKWIESGGNDGA